MEAALDVVPMVRVEEAAVDVDDTIESRLARLDDEEQERSLFGYFNKINYLYFYLSR